MDLNQLSKENKIMVVVSLSDLCEFAHRLIEEYKTLIDDKTDYFSNNESYLTTEDVLRLLKVDRSTLWRWNNSHYLSNIKIGRRTYYRKEDVYKILNK